MDFKSISLGAFMIVVILLLVGLPFYSGTFLGGYDMHTHQYEHEIVAGPTVNTAEEVNLSQSTESEATRYQYEELSPAAKDLFDQTRAADSSTYTPKVCESYVLVCNSYYEADLPSEFTYGYGFDSEDAEVYTVIEDGSDEYLLRTGTSHTMPSYMGLGMVSLLLRGLMIIQAVTLTITAGIFYHRSTVRNRGTFAAFGAGALFVAWGVLTPYIEIFVGISHVTSMNFALPVGGLVCLIGPYLWLFEWWSSLRERNVL